MSPQVLIVACPLIAWPIFSLLLPHVVFGRKVHWRLDPDSNSPWSFLPLYEMYRRWMDRLCVASALGYWLTRNANATAASLFSGSIVAALAFLGSLTWFYESDLHSRFMTGTAQTYTTARYALVLALGASAFVEFFLAVLIAI